jgi:transcriptional regulator with PAS, ATPase and Fis domain
MSATGTHFRWQAFFQRSRDALFVLNHQCRLLFVNTAWERLVGLACAEVRGRACRRQRPVGAEIADPDQRNRKILAHALTPPPEVLAGHAARTRRLLPGGPLDRRWWDVEFLPFTDADGSLLGILGRILPVTHDPDKPPLNLPERLVTLRERSLQRPSIDWLGTASPALRRVADQVRLAASVRVPVLFVGEAGTGKQTLARIVHALSPGRERSLAVLDCERLPQGVLADLLFGPAGLASHGVETIYLREPGRLPAELQSRLVEGYSASPAGAGPRLLAGCREPLKPGGPILEALAGILGTLVVPVPPLRERRDDLLRLIESCLERLAERDGKLVVEVSPEALALLRDHSWPGNVRELLEALSTARERASGERIEAGNLPSSVRLPQLLNRTVAPPVAGSLPLDTLLEQAERRLIELALERAAGNKMRAADLLGIPRERLWRRIKALGIADGDVVPEGAIKLELE